VIAGAALWGMPGMFLSIPFVAIFKLILDNIESLKHYGVVLGEPVKAIKKIRADDTSARKGS
jgi:predicted PurR-regulated permease PerM